MHLSGQFRWYQIEFALMGLFAGVLFVIGILCVLFGGILGALYAINVDHTLWPIVPAGWGVGAIAACVSAWLTRRLLRTIRWFELDDDRLRYECLGSRRRFTYHVQEVNKIVDHHYQRQRGSSYWKIVFADKTVGLTAFGRLPIIKCNVVRPCNGFAPYRP